MFLMFSDASSSDLYHIVCVRLYLVMVLFRYLSTWLRDLVDFWRMWEHLTWAVYIFCFWIDIYIIYKIYCPNLLSSEILTNNLIN